jgi:exonuclease III
MGYTLHHNSTRNSRGTAILISNKLEYNVHNSFFDAACNMLLMKLSVGEVTITIGSIYGPNDDSEEFFNVLGEKIKEYNSNYVVVGSDWNCTYDTNNSRSNIDILNTVNPPGLCRSQWLKHICTTNKLLYPFRHFFPDAREFTYILFAADANNTSRLDFFLISEDLLEQCVNCRIPHSVCSLLFDHKAVFLCFRRDNPYKKQIINDTILKDADFDEIVLITAVECYINHLLPSDTYSDIDIQNFKMHVGLAIQHHKEFVGIRLMEAENGIDQITRERVGVIKNSIQTNLSDEYFARFRNTANP